MESNDLSAQRKALYERFSELARLFADRIPSWEVTNELLYIPGAGHKETKSFRSVFDRPILRMYSYIQYERKYRDV